MVLRNYLVGQFNDLLAMPKVTNAYVTRIIIYLTLTPKGYFSKSLVPKSYAYYRTVNDGVDPPDVRKSFFYVIQHLISSSNTSN